MSATVKNITSYPLILTISGKMVPLLPKQSVEVPESALVALAPLLKEKLQVVKSHYQVEMAEVLPLKGSVPPPNVETVTEYAAREVKDSPGDVSPSPAKPKRARKKKSQEE